MYNRRHVNVPGSSDQSCGQYQSPGQADDRWHLRHRYSTPGRNSGTGMTRGPLTHQVTTQQRWPQQHYEGSKPTIPPWQAGSANSTSFRNTTCTESHIGDTGRTGRPSADYRSHNEAQCYSKFGRSSGTVDTHHILPTLTGSNTDGWPDQPTMNRECQYDSAVITGSATDGHCHRKRRNGHCHRKRRIIEDHAARNDKRRQSCELYSGYSDNEVDTHATPEDRLGPTHAAEWAELSDNQADQGRYRPEHMKHNQYRPKTRTVEEKRVEPRQMGVESRTRETTCVLTEMIKGSESPMLGLSFITELQTASQPDSPKYTCSLCDCNCGINFIIPHITGLQHRTKFMEKFHAEEYQQIADIADRAGKRAQLEYLAKLIEVDLGREEINVKLLDAHDISATRSMENNKPPAMVNVRREENNVKLIDTPDISAVNRGMENNRPPAILCQWVEKDMLRPVPRTTVDRRVERDMVHTTAPATVNPTRENNVPSIIFDRRVERDMLHTLPSTTVDRRSERDMVHTTAPATVNPTRENSLPTKIFDRRVERDMVNTTAPAMLNPKIEKDILNISEPVIVNINSGPDLLNFPGSACVDIKVEKDVLDVSGDPVMVKPNVAKDLKGECNLSRPLKKIQKFLNRNLGQGKVPSVDTLVIVADSKGNCLKEHVDDVTLNKPNIIWWCEPDNSSFDALQLIEDKIDWLAETHGRVCILFWHMTYDIVNKLGGHIFPAYECTEDLFKHMNQYFDRLVVLHGKHSNVNIGILELPYIFTKMWNKQSDYEFADDINDRQLNHQVKEVNVNVIRVYNTALGYRSPTFQCNFLRTKRTSKAAQRRQYWAQALTTDGIHPKPIVATSMLHQIIGSILIEPGDLNDPSAGTPMS